MNEVSIYMFAVRHFLNEVSRYVSCPTFCERSKWIFLFSCQPLVDEQYVEYVGVSVSAV